MIELQKFLFGLLGALIGGSLFAWANGYYSERGKRLATKEDIDNVVEQLRIVTKETERIKAEIAQGVWHGQWALGQKRDSYVRLIDTLENLQLRRIKLRNGPDENARMAARVALSEAIDDFRRARAIARLVVGPKVIETIGRILRRLELIDPTSSKAEAFLESENIIREARDNVVALGKSELNLS